MKETNQDLDRAKPSNPGGRLSAQKVTSLQQLHSSSVEFLQSRMMAALSSFSSAQNVSGMVPVSCVSWIETETKSRSNGDMKYCFNQKNRKRTMVQTHLDDWGLQGTLETVQRSYYCSSWTPLDKVVKDTQWIMNQEWNVDTCLAALTKKSPTFRAQWLIVWCKICRNSAIEMIIVGPKYLYVPWKH